MGWAISTAVRFEHGGKPSLPMLAQMLEAADVNALDDIAAEIQIHLNVALGPNVPPTPDPTERLFIALAWRIFQNKKRHSAFLKFADPEVEILRAEAALTNERSAELFAGVDAYSARLTKKGENENDQ
jgi:hypothetical protein